MIITLGSMVVEERLKGKLCSIMIGGRSYSLEGKVVSIDILY